MDCAIKTFVFQIFSSFLIVFLCAASSVRAQDFFASHKASFLSEYYARGISQTRELPAPQLMSTLAHSSGVFGGFFVTRVEYLDDDQAGQELDFFLAYQNKVEDVYYRTGLIYYLYPGAAPSKNYNFVELDVALGYDFDWIYSELTTRISPNYFGGSGFSTYTKLEARMPIVEKVTMQSHLAYRSIEDNETFYGIPDSFDWEVGFEYKPIENIGLVGKYVDSDIPVSGCFGKNYCDERLIAGINWYF